MMLYGRVSCVVWNYSPPLTTLCLLCLQTPRLGHGCLSSATFETSVAELNSDNWKTPVATWSISSRSCITTATPAPDTSDSLKKISENHTGKNTKTLFFTSHPTSQSVHWPIVASETLENCPPTVHILKPHNRPLLCENPATICTETPQMKQDNDYLLPLKSCLMSMSAIVGGGREEHF